MLPIEVEPSPPVAAADSSLLSYEHRNSPRVSVYRRERDAYGILRAYLLVAQQGRDHAGRAQTQWGIEEAHRRCKQFPD
jgi:hypothetical protein